MLDFEFVFIRKLETVGTEYLDAVVSKWIVTRADDDTCVGTHGMCEVCDSRRGHGATQHDSSAHRADPRGDCLLQHVAGKPCVFTYDNARAFAPTSSGDKSDRSA